MNFFSATVGTYLLVTAVLFPISAYAYGHDLDSLKWELQDIKDDLRDTERSLNNIKSLNQKRKSIQVDSAYDLIRDEATRALWNSSPCTREIDNEINQILKSIYGERLKLMGEITHLSPSHQNSILAAQRSYHTTKIRNRLLLREQILRSCSSATNTNPQASGCPLHSSRSADGTTCECDIDYEPDPTETYCSRIRSKKKVPVSSPPAPSKLPIDTVLDCQKGYGLSLNKKFCLKIPNNAHYVDSPSDIWLCDTGYIERGKTCVPEKQESGDVIEATDDTPDEVPSKEPPGDELPPIKPKSPWSRIKSILFFWRS